MTVLHLESFENNLFELDFSISKKNVFLQSNPLRKTNFLAQLCREYFLRFFLLSIYQTISESVRSCFRKKSDLSQQPQAE